MLQFMAINNYITEILLINNFEVPRSDQTSISECDWSNLSYYR